jgi:hypothetical protein
MTLHDQIKEQMEKYLTESERFDVKGIKGASTTARKALGEIAKLCKSRRAEIQEKRNNM